MKYIIFKDRNGINIPVIFSALIEHKRFAEKFPELTPVSAGHFSCDTERVSMGGDSVSLKLKSDKNDKNILKINADFYV